MVIIFWGELLITFSRHFEEKFSAAGAVVVVFVEGWVGTIFDSSSVCGEHISNCSVYIYTYINLIVSKHETAHMFKTVYIPRGFLNHQQYHRSHDTP